MSINKMVWMVRLANGLAVVVGAGLASGQVLIDNFDDDNDDGWTRFDDTIGRPWGPGTYDAINGAYHLQGGHPVPTGRYGLMASCWDESMVEANFSNGLLTATLRANNATTLPALGMRVQERDWYWFGGNPTTGQFWYAKVVGRHVVASDAFDAAEPFRPGEDWILEAGTIGQQLSMKAWKLGAQEPTSPQWTLVDDPSLGQGFIAVSAFHWETEATPPGLVHATFDDIHFTPIPEPSGLVLLIPIIIIAGKRRSRRRHSAY